MQLGSVHVKIDVWTRPKYIIFAAFCNVVHDLQIGIGRQMEKKITDHTTEEEEETETLWKMIQKEIWTFTRQGDIAVTFSAEKKNATQVKIYDLSFLYIFFRLKFGKK